MNVATYNRTKIIATVGPACNTKEKLLELMVAGVDVFRLNFSHGTHEQHLAVIKSIRELNQKFESNITILQDLQGPKIRMRTIENDGVEVKNGETVIIAHEEAIGTRARLTSTYDLAQDVKAGEPILIDDGNIELRTIKVEGNAVYAEVIHGGIIKSRKGINLPNTKVSANSLTPKDREDLIFGLENDVDWIALSFVRSAVDILELRNIMQQADKMTKIIAKIETPLAVRNIEEIVRVTDAVMVARGDLGVEIPMEEVPLVQKRIVHLCNILGKPVIIATQMMESMIKNPRPTRAETNDVANAVIDGADVLMLSAETASGNFPLETVKSMVKTIGYIEKNRKEIFHRYFEVSRNQSDFVSEMLLTHACKLAQETEAKAIVCMTKSGYTAYQIACRRPEANIFVFTRSRNQVTVLNLVWGVRSFLFDNPQALSNDEIFASIEKTLVDGGFLKKGDVYISTRGSGEGAGTNVINVLKVSR